MRGRQVSCCFTGHRPGKLPWRYDEEDPRCAALKKRIFDAAEAAYQDNPLHVAVKKKVQAAVKGRTAVDYEF